ncbi:MAG: T9SS type A sorting domain-containing protein [Bacteroidia bacterium]|nr:T9SS type A sorting domain-containing protein [Bacteroidia bacterium]
MKRFLSISLVIGLFLMLFTLQLVSFSGGPPAGRTGAPGESTCNAAGCHNSFTLNSGVGEVSIFSNAPAEGYTPGETYTLTYKIKESGINKFGFSSTVYSPAEMGFIGSFMITDMTNTREYTGGDRQYVSHTSAGNAATDSQMWSIDWEAPEAGAGEVDVYAAFNAANGANGNQGDHIYTDRLTISENVSTSVNEEETLKSLKWFQNGSQLFVNYEMKTPGNLDWFMLDMSGKEVYREYAYSLDGSYEGNVDVSTFPKGVYILKIKSPGKLLSRKILIQ